MSEFTTTVHIVDDDHAILDSTAALLESDGLKTKVYDAPEKFLAVEDLEPGCVILDVRMPVMDGFEVFHRLREHHQDLPVLFATAYAEVPSAVRAIRGGAFEFLEKTVSADVFLSRVREAIELGRELERERRRSDERRKQLASLTPREREVTGWVWEGRSSQQISDELGIAHKTVEVHRSHVMQKMRAVNVADLIRRVSEVVDRPEDLRP